MARLILIRHTLTAVTGHLLTGRLPGFGLSPAGQSQAEELGTRIRAIGLHAIYTSPLQRTRETAAAVANHQRRPRAVNDHPGLLEVDYGDWSGRRLGSLTGLQAWRTVTTAPGRMRFPGGESLLEAQVRAVSACEEMGRRHRHQSVALVTHADIVKLVVSHYLGQPLDLFGRLAVAPGSVTVIDLEPATSARLVTLNSNGDPTTWQ